MLVRILWIPIKCFSIGFIFYYSTGLRLINIYDIEYDYSEIDLLLISIFNFFYLTADEIFTDIFLIEIRHQAAKKDIMACRTGKYNLLLRFLVTSNIFLYFYLVEKQFLIYSLISIGIFGIMTYFFLYKMPYYTFMMNIAMSF